MIEAGQYWTGIGTTGKSKIIPPDIAHLARRIGYHLTEKGMVFRSGEAPGMDSHFKQGVLDYMDLSGCGIKFETFIGWKGFENHYKLGPEFGVYLLDEFMSKFAETLLYDSGVFRGFDYVTRGVNALFKRNVYQIIGLEYILSKFVVYYTDETSYGKVAGGTSIAVHLARTFNIPTYNLKIPEQRKAFLALIGMSEEE